MSIDDDDYAFESLSVLSQVEELPFPNAPPVATRPSKYFFLCLPLDLESSISPSKTSFPSYFPLLCVPKISVVSEW